MNLSNVCCYNDQFKYRLQYWCTIVHMQPIYNIRVQGHSPPPRYLARYDISHTLKKITLRDCFQCLPMHYRITLQFFFNGMDRFHI